VTAQVVNNTRALLKGSRPTAPVARPRPEILPLRAQLEHYAALSERVIDQAQRRVLHGEQVGAQQKLYAIFEPHTDLIKRGKANTPVEFGHKVLLTETRLGLISDYQVLDGNPTDDTQVEPNLQRHYQRFGKVPKLYSTPPTAAFIALTTSRCSAPPASRWRVFRNAEDAKLHSVQPMRKAAGSSTRRSFVPALKDVSAC
jgi:hypothetical protein